jgi:NTP pyrophosphatase (non-canonical NTP hydrolase)
MTKKSSSQKEQNYPVKTVAAMNGLVDLCHGIAKDAGWWSDIETGAPIQRNKGELLCLIHSEISEAMEGERKDLMDDKLPHRKMAEVELADAVIRICDYAGAHGYDLGGALVEKLKYNMSRADHKPENRAQVNGKKF